MFSDAVDREATWLNTFGDGLPSLNAAQGGPFQILQARWPRIPSTSKTQLYVLRNPSNSYRLERFADIRSQPKTELMLKLLWPMTQGSGSGEAEQLLFEQAIDQVLLRVQGPLTDKTHGGQFLSVAEGHAGITVNYDDIEQTMQARVFKAAITYTADDTEIIN